MGEEKKKISLNVKFENSKMKVTIFSCTVAGCITVAPYFLMLNPHVTAPALVALFVKSLLVNKLIDGKQNQLNGKPF